VPPRPPRSGSRTTRKRCADTGCSTRSARAPSPPPCRSPTPVLRLLEAYRGHRTEGPLVLWQLSGKPIDRRDCHRMVLRARSPPGPLGTLARTRCGTPRSPTPSSRRSGPGRADPHPACRPVDHGALRPRPRHPRPARRPLPHHLHRRRVSCHQNINCDPGRVPSAHNDRSSARGWRVIRVGAAHEPLSWRRDSIGPTRRTCLRASNGKER
jgi:hypothetical protein